MHVSYIMLSPPVYGPNKYAPRFHHKLNSCFNGWCPNCSQRNAAPAPCVQIWCGTLKVHAHTCNVQKKKKLRVCIAFIHIGNQLAPRAQSSMSLHTILRQFFISWSCTRWGSVFPPRGGLFTYIFFRGCSACLDNVLFTKS